MYAPQMFRYRFSRGVEGVLAPYTDNARLRSVRKRPSLLRPSSACSGLSELFLVKPDDITDLSGSVEEYSSGCLNVCVPEACSQAS
jgi:hypothetical protein